jgi:hypothetical protein
MQVNEPGEAVIEAIRAVPVKSNQWRIGKRVHNFHGAFVFRLGIIGGTQ